MFECECEPGWKGGLCGVEINECTKYKPCHNGAQCVDLLADYDCVCVDAATDAVQYGGKNCTVELTGCEASQCVNNATCSPFLQEEASAVHNHTCSCLPGYAGYYCDLETTAQYSGDSWLRYLDSFEGVADFVLSVGFRTTLPDGLLAINVQTNDENSLDYILLELTGGSTLQLTYHNLREHRTLNLKTPNVRIFNDAQWHEVQTKVDYAGLTLMVYDSDCPEGVCSTANALEATEAIQLHHPIGDTYIGGVENSVSDSEDFPQVPPYTGCIRDVAVNSFKVVPEQFKDTSSNVELGCPREEQCEPDPCNGHGECQDLWIQWKCECRRPYLGVSCQKGQLLRFMITIPYSPLP